MIEKLWDEKLNGWAWQIKSEFVSLLKLMQSRRICSVLEIGTNKGGTAFGYLSLGCLVTSLDIQTLPEVAAVEDGFPVLFRFINVDSRTYKTTNMYDMLFIDGDHSYEGVKADYDNFIGNVNKDGIVVFHDIKESELHRKQNCHVAKFWQEIKGDNFVEFCDPLQQWGGIGVKFI